MALQAINPTTGEVSATYQELSAEAAQSIIADTHQAYLRWRATKFRAHTLRVEAGFDLSHAPWQTRRGWWRNVKPRPDRPTHTQDGRP